MSVQVGCACAASCDAAHSFHAAPASVLARLVNEGARALHNHRLARASSACHVMPSQGFAQYVGWDGWAELFQCRGYNPSHTRVSWRECKDAYRHANKGWGGLAYFKKNEDVGYPPTTI